MAILPAVFIVDGDDETRIAMSKLLAQSHFRVQDYAAPDDFLNAVAPERSGCLLLELRPPGMHGLQMMELLTNQNYSLPTIFISASATIRETVLAIKGGALNVLQKPVNAEELREQVEAALRIGGRTRALDELRRDFQRKHLQLTAREKEIAALIVAGHCSREVGRLLSISPRTVDHHRANILRKMNVSSVPELAALTGSCYGRPTRNGTAAATGIPTPSGAG